MKTFNDLIFKPHSIGDGIQARIKFPDGSEISVIQGESFYSGTGSYEMLSNRTNRKHHIRGWITPKQITAHMKYIQQNPIKTK